MPTLAVRLAYDGSPFSGSQRQPDRRTVEGDVLSALEAIGAGTKGFRTASRTDAGVSAIGNAFVVETAFDASELAAATSAHLTDAWCCAVADVPAGFDPRRSARQRAYRYFLARANVDREPLRAALSTFEGEHDFSAFARVEPHRSPRRTVTRTEVHERGEFYAIDVAGPSFLWNQVRRMVATALAHARGELSLQEIARALQRGDGAEGGVAPAEGLILLDVDLGVSWRWDASALRRAREALSVRVLSAASARVRAESLLEGLDPAGKR